MTPSHDEDPRPLSLDKQSAESPEDWLEDVDETEYAALLAKRDELEEQLANLTQERARLTRNILDQLCLPGPATTSLADILDLSDVPAADDEQADTDVDQALFDQYTNPEELQRIIGCLRPSEFASLRTLMEAGGRKNYRKKNTNDLDMARDLPRGFHGLCSLFAEDDHYVAVMPDEVFAVAKEFDWDELSRAIRRNEQMVRFFDAVAELRGVLPFTKALAEYVALFPEDGRDVQEIADSLMSAVEDDVSSACFLDTGNEFYLIHHLLQSERRAEFGEEPYRLDVCDEGEPGRLVAWILKEQARKVPRPVAREMLTGHDLFEWKAQLPASLAMCDFLDHHVPAERDVRFFPEKVLEELFNEAMWGQTEASLDAAFDILEDNDFLPNDRQANMFTALWNNLCNSLPNWPNNGWSPNELANRGPGKRMFFNADGSVMRVGRNDPCPCGSGKKYKRCCGR
jgi:hypothetical protein